MKALPRLTITLASGIGLLTSTCLAAQTSGRDYDGVWTVTTQCGPQLLTGRPGFTGKTEFTLLRGRIEDTKSQVVAGVREETRWESWIEQRQLVLQGQAHRDNGASWSYQLSGPLTPDHATLSGSMTAQG